MNEGQGCIWATLRSCVSLTQSRPIPKSGEKDTKGRHRNRSDLITLSRPPQKSIVRYNVANGYVLRRWPREHVADPTSGPISLSLYKHIRKLGAPTGSPGHGKEADMSPAPKASHLRPLLIFHLGRLTTLCYIASRRETSSCSLVLQTWW